MAIAITDELIAALASKLQVGPDMRVEGELEIDWVYPGFTDLGALADLALAIGTCTGYTSDAGIIAAPANPANAIDGNDSSYSVSNSGVTPIHDGRHVYVGWLLDFGADVEISYLEFKNTILSGGRPTRIETQPNAGGGYTVRPFTESVPVTNWYRHTLTGGPITGRYVRYLFDHQLNGGAGFGYSYFDATKAFTARVWARPLVAHAAEIRTAVYQVERWDIDRSRKMAAAQLDAVLANTTGGKGYYSQANPIFVPHNEVRAYAWYGVHANRVLRFRGLIDVDADHRDPDVATVELKARSRTSLLLDPHKFVATAPQGAGETGAVRTEANGVFLSKSPEYIAGKILDMAGWPTADRDFAVSGVTIPEYDLADGGQWLDQIAGDGKLTQIAGWDFGEDEAGVAHLGPNALLSVTEPAADWTLDPSQNVYAFDHQADDIEQVTRVRVSGPMASTIPKWSKTWGTTKLDHPTGLMYRPSEPGYLYAVDRITQYLYKLRQSDRKVVASWPLGASLTNQPIGLSADPTDSAHFYVLDAHQPGSGVYTNCKVRKYSFAAPSVVVATTTLADGQWSDMKFDGTHLFLTNFGDDKLYVKTFVAGGAAGATSSHTYAGHTNPTGLYLNGTTIGLFFNGGQAFYLIDTGTPGTITGSQSTKGTTILGGEADTTTDVDLYASNQAGDFGATAGHIWKFALAEAISIDVVKWATDEALEDALGLQAGLASRVHDLHSGDAAHPWEARIATVELQTVNSEAQCQAVADATLVLRKRIRRVMDLGVMGNPAIQIGDVVEYPDTVAATDATWMVDSERERLEADPGRYTMTMSVLPWEAAA